VKCTCCKNKEVPYLPCTGRVTPRRHCRIDSRETKAAASNRKPSRVDYIPFDYGFEDSTWSNRFEEYSFHIRFSLIVFSKLSSKFHEQRSQQKSCVGTNPTCSLNVTKIQTSVDRNVYETFENVQIFRETFEIVRKITIWENVQCFYHAQVSCRLEEFGKLTQK